MKVAPRAALGDLLRRDELAKRCSTSALKGAGDDGFTRQRTRRSASPRAVCSGCPYVARRVRLKARVMVASRKYAPGDQTLIAAMPQRRLVEE